MRTAMLAPIILAGLAAAAAGCIPVEGERILGADLERAHPAFAGLPAEVSLAYAPAPDLRRTLSAAQLRRIAARFGLPDPGPESVCFVRAARPLDREQVEAAVRAAWGEPGARVEVVDFIRHPAPAGTLRFRRSGLSWPVGGAAGQEVLWRGAVEFDGRRSFPVWARVRIVERRRSVVAAADLAAGHPLAAADLAERTIEGPPEREPPIERIADAAGSIPRRRIPAGTPIRPSLIRFPNEIEAGETIRVEVASGGAHLLLEARAESAGRRDGRILVRHPATGKRFTATVAGPGCARLLLDKPGGERER
jgi:flagella basal body P-ring formation protein FlgA